MWMIVPIFCLAIIHISGNNVAVIPDIVGSFEDDQSIVSIFGSMVFGVIIAAVIAWIGVMTGQDLVVATKKQCGVLGRKIVALTLLSVSIPASSLTGCYYAGGMLQFLFGLPYWLAALACLILFSLLAIAHSRELLTLSNYIGLLLLPLIILIFFLYDVHWYKVSLNWNHINWSLVLALTGYNVGGMWVALLMETTAYLSQKGSRAIVIVVLAKIVESIITLGVAYLVLSANAQGPLALTVVVSKISGVAVLFNIVLFCTLVNTMAPAMLLNARQMSSLTGLTFWPALFVVITLIYIISFIPFSLILSLMSYTGFLMILFIIYTAYFLHKYGINQ
ncbi:hypothetical protein [Pelosinus sp. sgz500959]|uniref:hypothetical protein n=1 Tax=Pelosinus sp. sgz500959 TaxID=3242472 RepID=UPI00366AC2F0